MHDGVGQSCQGRRIILKAWVGGLVAAAMYLLLTPPLYQASAVLKIDHEKLVTATPWYSDSNSDSASEAEWSSSQPEYQMLLSGALLRKVAEDLNLGVKVSPRLFPIFGEALVAKFDKHDGVSSAWPGFQRWAWGGETLIVDRFDVPDRYLDKAFTLVALENSRFQLLDPKGRMIAEGPVGELLVARIFGENQPVVIELGKLLAHPGTVFGLVRNSSLTAIEDLQKAFFFKNESDRSRLLRVELKGHDPEQLARTANAIAYSYLNHINSGAAGISLFGNSFRHAALTNTEKPDQLALTPSGQTKSLIDPFEENWIQPVVARQTPEQINHPTYDQQDNTTPSWQFDRNAIGLERAIAGKAFLQDQDCLLPLQLEQHGTVGSITTGVACISELAERPAKPYWPKPALILGIASLLGLGLGAVLVILQKTLRPSLRPCQPFPSLLENRIGFLLMTAVSHPDNYRRMAGLADQSKAGDPMASFERGRSGAPVQSLSGLYTLLDATLACAESKVIMIASPKPGMGEAFASRQLSMLLADTRKRVLLIDADMNAGCLHELFSKAQQPGLSELLSGQADLGDTIISLPNINLDLMPKGASAFDSTQKRGGELLLTVLEHLKSFYNHIVINSPPIVENKMAASLARYCDLAFLLVTEEGGIAPELESGFMQLPQALGISEGFSEPEQHRHCGSFEHKQDLAKHRCFRDWHDWKARLKGLYAPLLNTPDAMDKSF